MVNVSAPSHIDRVIANIKRLLSERDWTQGKLADRAALSEGYLSRLLAGHYQAPSATRLQKIARALGITLEQLTGETPLVLPGELALSPEILELVRKASLLPTEQQELLDDIAFIMLI